MSTAFVYQVIDDNLYTIGIFTDADVAIAHARQLCVDRARYFQVNRIPLNVVGHFGESFDVVWSPGGYDT